MLRRFFVLHNLDRFLIKEKTGKTGLFFYQKSVLNTKSILRNKNPDGEANPHSLGTYGNHI
jgi:hypothetical protein